MATTTTSTEEPPRLALFPCAGMGHLLPFLRLAAMLTSRGCAIVLITAEPTVSAAESHHLSTFFTTYPQIKRLQFHLLPPKKSQFTNEDPFFIQMESIINSVHLLHPLLSSLSPSLSAIVADFPVANSVTELASRLSITTYTLITTSARFFILMSYLPKLAQCNALEGKDYIEVPSLGLMPVSSIPPPMLNPNHFFAANIISNVSSLSAVKGILINTFSSFESEAIEALRRNGVANLLPIGPFECFEPGQGDDLPWLDEQGPESVVFVSFGSRTALSKDQIRELCIGLERSGCKFLWVLKGGKVDRCDNEGVEEILGRSFLARTNDNGMVIKGWVDQEKVLAHPAVGGFVSHCGWNSVTEAARLGVPVLAWPLHGDQRVNAEVVEKAGLGLWAREWGLDGEKVVDGDQIAEKIIEVMLDKNLRGRAKEVKEKAQQARERNGTSELLLQGLIESLKSKEKARDCSAKYMLQ